MQNPSHGGSVGPSRGLVQWLAVALLLACGCSGASSGESVDGDTHSPETGAEAGASNPDSMPQPGERDASSPRPAVDASVPVDSELRIDPAGVVLTVNARDVKATHAFIATLLPSGTSVRVRWQVEGEIASVDQEGVVSTRGIVAGKTLLTAVYGDLTAQAEVSVQVDLNDGASASDVPADQRTALDGPALADPGDALSPKNPMKVLYPYDGTVMPRGLSAPIVQLSPGSLPPQDLKLRVETEGFTWSGYSHVASAAKPRITPPQDIWDAALGTARGKQVRLSVVKAVDGVAYGPATVHITTADGTLKGAVYYMTYEAAALGLWSVRPGVNSPPKHIVSGCVVCHSASSNGQRLSTGADDASVAKFSGVYTMGASGEATQITGAPSGFGGDSRGLSFATFTPDGRYVMRSQNNFWGGANQRAFWIDDANKALVEANVVGLGAQVSAYLPTFSHDGKQYAFTNGAGETAPVGTVSRSLSVMNVSIDDTLGTGGTLTFEDRKVVVDNGPGGSVVKFATFMPDANQLAFQEGESYQQAYNEMLPTWGPSNNFKTATGRLAMVHVDDKTYTRLERLNEGQVELDKNRNYEPFALPVTAGGYFWVVFTSTREYGNTYTGGAVRKQLWVAAISPNAPKGQDPSHPAFFLPNQGESSNERGFWALEPCRAEGSGCETGDECCGGFCRPADAQKPELGSVCLPPDDIMCAELHERCAETADCCGAAQGAQCIGGYCDKPAPPPPVCSEEGESCKNDVDCCGYPDDGFACFAGVCRQPVIQ